MGIRPYEVPKAIKFLPPTTGTMAAPGFSGKTSAAKVVVVMMMQVKEN